MILETAGAGSGCHTGEYCRRHSVIETVSQKLKTQTMESQCSAE
jgi:hypothetical protein